MSDTINVTVTDTTLDVVDVTVLDQTETVPVTIIDSDEQLVVALTESVPETISVSVFTDPLDEIFVTLSDGVSDQDLNRAMTDWHWPKSVVLGYLPGGQLTTITKESGEILQLNRTGETLTSISSSEGWVKTLSYNQNDQLIAVSVS